MKARRNLCATLCLVSLALALAGGASLSFPPVQPQTAQAQGPEPTPLLPESGLPPSGKTADPPATLQLPQITAASTVVQVGQWVTVTLTHGQPGHQGFFDAETPLRYQRTDGQPCAPGFACVTINAQGQAQALVQAIAAGDAVIHFVDTTAEQVVPAAVRVRFYEGITAPSPPQQSNIYILGVTSDFPISGPYLIDAWPVATGNNQVLVHTNMNAVGSDQQYVWLNVNGHLLSPRACDEVPPDPGYQEMWTVCRFFLPYDVKDLLQPGDNTLIIVVGEGRDPSDPKSDPVSYALPAVQSPEWLPDLNPAGDIHLTSDGSNLVYEMSVVYPVGGMNWLAPTLISDDGSRGTALGLLTSGVGHIIPCKKQLLYKTLTKSFATKLYGMDLTGDVNATGELDAVLANCSIWHPELVGTLTANGDARASSHWNLWSLLSDYFGSTAAAIIELFKPLPEFLDVSLSAEIDPSLNGQFTIRPQKPHVQADLDVQAPLQLTGTGNLMIPIPLSYVRFSLAGSGKGSFSLPNVTDFKDRELTANIGYKVGTWGVISSIPFEFKCTGQSSYPGGSSHDCGGWLDVQLPDRTFGPAYATFRATPGQAQAFSQAGWATTATLTGVLVSDLYTYTQPALAISPSNDHALTLWVHDAPTKPSGASHEIYFSHWDGLTWRSPAAITDDDLMDEAPQVAWTGGGQAVAVWQRLAHSLPPTATWDSATTNWLEVASAVYSATAHTWSPPIALTANSVADVSPQLARNSSGKLLIAWVQNDYGQFIGDDAHPSRLMAAFYDGAWNTPSVVADPITGVTSLAVGYGDNHATIVLSRWITPTGSLTAKNQLFAITWNGNAWSAPRQLTYDTLDHMWPNVVYNNNNEPIIVWYTDDILRLQNLQNGTVAAVRVPREVGHIGQLRAASDPSGNILALISAYGSQPDLYLAYYDRAHNLWGRPRRLTNDRHIETFADLALDSTDRLLAVYPLIIQDNVTHTMTLSNGQVVTFTVPVDRQTDLVTLSHSLTRNVSLATDALSVSNAHPAPGSAVMVYAQVHNTGDLPVEGLAVSFYDGDPDTGGLLIGTSTYSLPLTSGFMATLAVTYTVPATGGPRTLYAIADPAHAIAESDESDNRASLSVFGPDLHLAAVRVSYPYGHVAQLRTVVHNLGTGTAPATTLAYYRDSVTGTLLLTQTIPALAYGQSLTMTSGLDIATMPEGQHNLVAVLDPHNLAGHGVGTKQRPFSLIVGPDVIVTPHSLWTTPLTGATVGITATVFNVGPVTATNVMVSFYAQPRLDGAAPLATQTIPSVFPGQAVPVSVQVRGPLWCGLYVYLDNEDSALENRRGDVAVVSGLWSTCHKFYLPIILRP